MTSNISPKKPSRSSNLQRKRCSLNQRNSHLSYWRNLLINNQWVTGVMHLQEPSPEDSPPNRRSVRQQGALGVSFSLGLGHSKYRIVTEKIWVLSDFWTYRMISRHLSLDPLLYLRTRSLIEGWRESLQGGQMGRTKEWRREGYLILMINKNRRHKISPHSKLVQVRNQRGKRSLGELPMDPNNQNQVDRRRERRISRNKERA